MATTPSFKYSLSLASIAVSSMSDFLTAKAKSDATKMLSNGTLPYPCELWIKPTSPRSPDWVNQLSSHFIISAAPKTQSSSGVLLFESGSRFFACSFGHGHTLVDGAKRESNFGLLVAANDLSDSSIKQVEKANLGTVVRDLSQAQGLTSFGNFGVDGALNIIRKISGRSKSDNNMMKGADTIALRSAYPIEELHDLTNDLLTLYGSNAYKSTAFEIFDKIRAIKDAALSDKLDRLMFANLKNGSPTFELGFPEVDSSDHGYIKIIGSRDRTQYTEMDLSKFIASKVQLNSVADLHNVKIAAVDISGSPKSRWSAYKCLVGSVLDGVNEYALNEGNWYKIDDALKNAANATFSNCSVGLLTSARKWKVIGAKTNSGGKDVDVYESEDVYNKQSAADSSGNLILFDKKMFYYPSSQSKLEICDLFDISKRRLIHVKRSGRRSSVISHFLMQGLNSAKTLRNYPEIRKEFFDKLESFTDASVRAKIEADFPNGWSVEFRFGDRPIASTGDYRIPMFSRITLEECNREILGLGYRSAIVSFVDI